MRIDEHGNDFFASARRRCAVERRRWRRQMIEDVLGMVGLCVLIAVGLLLAEVYS